MAKIPLRAYNREVEGMIDRGQAGLAIAHSRHILKYYPKHIDTYRLLGKAFLETQRYAEAADVLQRVLSTVPDDFISQIGMSIIREDEGNLDAAIWHMEKAFEAQPSNTAVQDELRRLYGRRDGVEPPKMRLTRGALVRMYARGELYQQAIAEIRAALAEDPLRVDLEVILARMYYLSGQTVAAIEVCSRLVNKLPYCFEANRILAEVLPTTSRAEDAKLYQQRVFAMDPYLAYLPPNAVSSTEVADNAVTLDQLEIQAGEEASQLPEWAQTVGVNWKADQAEDETLPDWFSTLKPDTEAEEMPPDYSAAAALGFQAAQSAETEPAQAEPTGDLPLIDTESDEEIPEWMKEAGWAPAESGDESAHAGFNLPEEELEIADIPDWLQEIAPEDAPLSGEGEVKAEGEDTNWLDSILPQEETSLESGEDEIPLDAEDEIPVEDTPLPEIDLSTESLLFTTQIEQPSDADDAAPFVDEDQPDWLKELVQSEPAGEPALPEDNAAPTSFEETPLETQAEFAETEQFQPESFALSEEMPDLNDLDATMAWMEGLAARQGADEETLFTAPEERQETPPDWVQALSDQIDENGEVEIPIETPLESEPNDLESLPQEEMSPEEISAADAGLPVEKVDLISVEDSSKVEASPTEELPDWLVESLEEEDQPAPTSPAETGWSESAAPAEIVETPAAEEKPTSTQPLDEDVSFAWLESLAARQGAEEGTLLVSPEKREQAMPDWIQETTQAETETQTLPEEPRFEATAPETEPRVEVTPFETTEIDAALDTIEDTQPVVLKTSEPPSLERIPEETPVPKDTDSTKSEKENVPEWLQSLDEETTAPPAPSEWMPEFELPVEETPAVVVDSLPPTARMDSADLLKAAQAALDAHNVERALQSYNQLIANGDYLEETIHDLRDALYRYPIDIAIWQSLGDAYMRSNHLQEALEAYTKAEELLR